MGTAPPDTDVMPACLPVESTYSALTLHSFSVSSVPAVIVWVNPKEYVPLGTVRPPKFDDCVQTNPPLPPAQPFAFSPLSNAEPKVPGCEPNDALITLDDVLNATASNPLPCPLYPEVSTLYATLYVSVVEVELTSDW